MGGFGGVSVTPSPSSSSTALNTGDRAYDQSLNGVYGGDVLSFKPESLSLSMSSNHAQQNNSLPRFGYEMAIPSVVNGGIGSASSSSCGQLRPFTSYASILKGTRFLRLVRQLLEEFCNVGRGIYAERFDIDDSLLMLDSMVENLATSYGDPDGE